MRPEDLATIPARFAAEALARLRLTAAARTRILRAAGVAPERLRRPEFRVTRRQFEAVFKGAVTASGDEGLGYLARPVPVGAFAFVLRTSARCADLAACLDVAIEHARLFDAAPPLTCEASDGIARLRVQPRTRVQSASILYTHSTLLTQWRTLGWLAGRVLPLRGIALPRRFHALAAETRYLFGRAPTFGRHAEITFSADLLRLPVIRTVADVERYVPGSLQPFLIGAPADALEQRVRTLLGEWRPFAGASVEELAARMGLSRQTLFRQLRDVGTTFAEVRDELRRDYAVAALSRAGTRAADVGDALGYSEPSAFARAFKAWTGETPARYGRRRDR